MENRENEKEREMESRLYFVCQICKKNRGIEECGEVANNREMTCRFCLAEKEAESFYKSWTDMGIKVFKYGPKTKAESKADDALPF